MATSPHVDIDQQVDHELIAVSAALQQWLIELRHARDDARVDECVKQVKDHADEAGALRKRLFAEEDASRQASAEAYKQQRAQAILREQGLV